MKTDPRFPKLHIVDHPLVQHKLSTMREKKTPSNSFRQLLRELTYLIGYEVTRDLPLETRTIDTPLCKCKANFIKGKKLVIIPILRAGLGMSEGLMDLMPSARVGHIGLYAVLIINRLNTLLSCPPSSKAVVSFCVTRCWQPETLLSQLSTHCLSAA